MDEPESKGAWVGAGQLRDPNMACQARQSCECGRRAALGDRPEENSQQEGEQGRSLDKFRFS